MVDIFDLLENILPYNLTFSLSLALIISLSILFASRYRTQWINIFDSVNILALRIFLIVFLLALPISSLTQSTSLTLYDFLTRYWWIILVYILFEAFLYGYRIYLRRLARVPKQYLNEIYQILTQRQDSDGGFRIGSKKETPVELWCTAQTLHGFILGFNDITLIHKTNKVLSYYQSVGRSGEALWSENQKNFLLIPATWALISLEELVSKEGYPESLSESTFKSAVEMVHSGLEKLKLLQLTNGGWAPAGNIDDDLRIFPTAIAIWALALAVKHQKALNLEREQLKETITSLSLAIELMKKKFDNNNYMWDNNPSRSVLRRISGLTLLVYMALSEADVALNSLKGSIQNHLSSNILHKWLDSIHEPIMAHIDFCLHRDIEDLETDGPYDNIIKAKIDSIIPIAFYDWLPAAMLAINASKITGRYKPVRDALREKRLTETLVKYNSHLPNWYTYRLAVIVIASSLS